uniref:Retrotrans_gag domain-containing protein n=1 Tax=Glossina pallidipes TaxID=7398 RepID=A0A1B0A8L3_GLOPL
MNVGRWKMAPNEVTNCRFLKRGVAELPRNSAAEARNCLAGRQNKGGTGPDHTPLAADSNLASRFDEEFQKLQLGRRDTTEEYSRSNTTTALFASFGRKLDKLFEMPGSDPEISSTTPLVASPKMVHAKAKQEIPRERDISDWQRQHPRQTNMCHLRRPCYKMSHYQQPNITSRQNNLGCSMKTYKDEKWHLKFDGSGKGLTVESLIFRIERLRQQQHLSHEDLFAEFHCLMAGQANKWYWQLMKDREGDSTFDYFSLKAELLNQFKAADSDYELIREVMERKQQSSESFEDYYAEIHDLTFRLRRKIPEPELIKIMKSNVKPSLATLIFATKVGSVAELKAECKRAEKLLKENRTRPRHVNEVGQEVEASGEAHRQTVEAFAPRHEQASDNQFRERQFQPATSRAGQPKQTTASAGAPLEQHTLRQTRGAARCR